MDVMVVESSALQILCILVVIYFSYWDKNIGFVALTILFKHYIANLLLIKEALVGARNQIQQVIFVSKIQRLKQSRVISY